MTTNSNTLQPQTTDADRIHQKPRFGQLRLQALLSNQAEGFAWTRGIHIYCEVRLMPGLEIASSEEAAQRYLQFIEDYTHAGSEAARLFGLDLLEAQGTVLHFHKEGARDANTFKEVTTFSYIFTKVLYEAFEDSLKREWNGFAICMDAGESIVVRHGTNSSSSAISLGPAANAPAKRLLYGKTSSGFAELPGAWLGRPKENWVAVNLRDREKAPFLREYENASVEAELRRLLSDYQSQRNQNPIVVNVPIYQASAVDQGVFSADRPYRMQAMCMRTDLDGFSNLVKGAFLQGREAVEAIAQGFIQIMQMADFFERQHVGTVRLPWAGDCITFFFPVDSDVESFRSKKWIGFVEQWQSFASATAEGKKMQWQKVFKDVAWTVGVSYGTTGNCLVAPIQTGDRKFLIGAGAPLAVASDAQEKGKSDDTLIHTDDHKALHPPVRKLFEKVIATEFWRCKKLTMQRVDQAIIEAGRSSRVEPCKSQFPGIVLPPPKPYCK